MSSMPNNINDSEDNINRQLKDFLENQPIYSPISIAISPKYDVGLYGSRVAEEATISPFPSELRLFCSYEECQHVQNFKTDNEYELTMKENAIFINPLYYCRNCYETHVFPIHIKSEYVENVNSTSEKDARLLQFTFTKYGQFPPNNIKTPNEIATLSKQINKDTANEIKQLFSNGMICEGHGLGIGAFSYYRQIVEIMRKVLFDLIISALEFNKIDLEIVEEYKLAKSENQFQNSMEHIKKTLPDSFKILGRNPIKILYKALSTGVHLNDKKDSDCLEQAKDLRLVLVETIKRLSELSGEDEQLTEAIKRISNF